MIFFTADAEEIIGYSFKDKILLRRAFTHRSYAYEYKMTSYENLEYLGDAILDFIVAEYLYKNFSNLDEGDMTKIRAEYVCAESLCAVSTRLGLDKLMLQTAGEEKNVNNRVKKYGDIYEAVIAAMYLDSNDMNVAREFILRTLVTQKKVTKKNDIDNKTRLQEYVQQKKLGIISYKELSRSGPDHAPVFTVAVLLDGEIKGQGTGASKKAAEQAAAEKAYGELKKRKGNVKN